MRYPEGPEGHLDEGTAHAWLDGQLPAGEAAALEAHVASCAACAAVVAEARGLVAGATRILGALDEAPVGPRSALGSPPSPSAVRRAPTAYGRRRWFVPAAAAATLLVAVTGTLAIRGGDAERASLARPDAAAPASDRAFEAASPPAASGAAGVAAGVAATDAASTGAAMPVTAPAAAPAPESRAGAGGPPQQQLATTAPDARNQSPAGGAANPRTALLKGAVPGVAPSEVADFSGRGVAGGVARGGSGAASAAPVTPPPAAPAEQTVAAGKEEGARMDSLAASAMRLRARTPAATLSDVVVTGVTAAKGADTAQARVEAARDRRTAAAPAVAAAPVAQMEAARRLTPRSVTAWRGCWVLSMRQHGLRQLFFEPDSTEVAGVVRSEPAPAGSPAGIWERVGDTRLRVTLRSGDLAERFLADFEPAGTMTWSYERGGQLATGRRVACPD